jgi:hypothetical protein
LPVEVAVVEMRPVAAAAVVCMPIQIILSLHFDLKL